MRSRGWKILFHDVRVWRTQVDLIVRAPDGLLVLVEVKSDGGGQAHLPRRQRMRLLQVGKLLAGYEPVELLLAFVDAAGVELLPVEF